jgi:hypothetical protein
VELSDLGSTFLFPFARFQLFGVIGLFVNWIKELAWLEVKKTFGIVLRLIDSLRW